jgi:hypothetical protein
MSPAISWQVAAGQAAELREAERRALSVPTRWRLPQRLRRH